MPPENDAPTTKASAHFDQPIAADAPRRQLDRKILESYDATQDRIRNISSRVTRIEALFDSISKDIRKIEELQKEMAGNLEATVAGMHAGTNKLAIHTEMEEYQWTVVNTANATLAQVGAALNDHLQAAGAITTRLDWLERITWALWGVVGAGAFALLPLVMKGLGIQ